MFTAMKGIIFILLLATFSCSGKVTITEDEIMPDIFYAEDSYRPFSGICIVAVSDTGRVLEQFSYKKGRLDGEALTWYSNGKLKRRGYYRNGNLYGNWEFWDQNGNLNNQHPSH
jgi:hypothetical protein